MKEGTYEREKMRIAAVVIIAGSLAGCGLAAKVDARNDYRASVATYKECLRSKLC
jgi:outer membrane murein-binding lipoprotein Lpp